MSTLAPVAPLTPAGKPPRRRRALWLLLAAVVALVAGTMGGGAVVNWLVEQSHTQTQTFPNSRVTAVHLSSPTAGFRVVAGPEGQAVVTETLHWVTAKPVVSTQLEGGVLSVSVSCDTMVRVLILGGDCGADVSIQVPVGASVQSTSDSGSLLVSALTGQIDAQTGSGSIELDGVSGKVTTRAGSGSIEGVGLLAEDVSALADSGSVDLDFARAPTQVTARVGSGSADILVPRGNQFRVTASASSGAASVDQDLSSPSAPGSISASASSGAVDIAYR